MSEAKLFKDVMGAIYDDGYLWIVVHGPPRSSKTTIALWVAYFVYKDWDKVIASIAFNLQGVIHRIKNGIPERWPTTNKLHMRVPFILYDDFGVHSNKADTQHSTAWDIFKGGFDCIGTDVGVLMATMVNAEEATSQLQNKYNAELTVNKKGHYKYDAVSWLQDFKGFRTKMKKTWIENGTFDPIPEDVYRVYDEMRKDLTREVYVRIQDALTVDSIDFVLRMIKPEDTQLLTLISNKGPIYYEMARSTLGEKYKDTITRCKARNLIIATTPNQKSYRYDISPLGVDVLAAIENKATAKKRNIYEEDR